MGLALSAIRHADEQFVDPVITPLPQGRCTIGRGDDADIALEDPTRRISRVHAVVTGQGDNFVLSVASSVNPVFVNGVALNAGQSRILSPGDELGIGDYVFHVVPLPPASGIDAATARDPFAAAPAGGRAAPLDDILGVLPSRAAPAAPHVPLDSVLGGPATAAPALNDILDGLGAGSSGSGRPGAAGDAGRSSLLDGGDVGGAGPLSSLFGSTSSGGLESMFRAGAGGADPLGLNRGARVEAGKGFSDGGRGGDHVHPVNLPFRPPAASAAPGAVPVSPPRAPASSRSAAGKAQVNDFLDILGPPAAGGGMNAQPDPLGILGVAAASEVPTFQEPTGGGPYVPPPGAAAHTKVDILLEADTEPTYIVPAAALHAPAAGAGAAAAAALFLRGAGVEGVNMSEAEAQSFLVESGALCRAAAEGVMALLLARATMRQELRAADRTMLAAKENNPLKMMDTPEEAVQFVFNPAMRAEGFLPPPQAVANAFKDLQAHEIAVMAGMRSALMGSIARFEPPNIEKRYDLASGGKSSLLANRKAKLWEFFVTFHAKTTEDAQDNFDKVYGADFLRAYMAQVKRLK